MLTAQTEDRLYAYYSSPQLSRDPWRMCPVRSLFQTALLCMRNPPSVAKWTCVQCPMLFVYWSCCCRTCLHNVPTYPHLGMLLQLGKRIGYKRVFHLYSRAGDNELNKAENQRADTRNECKTVCGWSASGGTPVMSIAETTASPPYTVMTAFPNGACSLAERQWYSFVDHDFWKNAAVSIQIASLKVIKRNTDSDELWIPAILPKHLTLHKLLRYLNRLGSGHFGNNNFFIYCLQRKSLA